MDSELYVHCNALVYLVLTHTIIAIAVVLVYIYISGNVTTEGWVLYGANIRTVYFAC